MALKRYFSDNSCFFKNSVLYFNSGYTALGGFAEPNSCPAKGLRSPQLLAASVHLFRPAAASWLSFLASLVAARLQGQPTARYLDAKCKLQVIEVSMAKDPLEGKVCSRSSEICNYGAANSAVPR